MIDNHPLLLNHLDFSDPLLLQQGLETIQICSIIKRSGKRLQDFHIWDHQDSIGSTRHISRWSLNDIILDHHYH
jgi:hypothetical protein